MVLRALRPQLKRLLLLKTGAAVSSTDGGIAPADILKYVTDMPPSWLLPVRNIQPVSCAQLEWVVEVEEMKQAARSSASRKQTNTLRSPGSVVLGGVLWGMRLRFEWDARKQGSTIGLYAEARNLLAGACCRCTYNLTCLSVTGIEGSGVCSFSLGRAWGSRDAFGLGAVRGGVDEAGWAANGLPTSGSIVLRLTAKDVGV
jgi:hypothetical protein